MKRLKAGPELKMPDFKNLKVPQPLVDLYWDLRDRHLLPLAILLVIALIAAPFLLAGSSESESDSEGATGATATTSGAMVHGGGALVAESTPGLRDYHHRLEQLATKNPFRQQFADDPSEAEGGESGTSSESTPETFSTGSPSTSGGGGSSEPSSGGLTYFSFAIDVRVSSGQDAQNSTVRRNLPELTMLPSREVPAAIFMGVTKDRKKALMLISSDVQAIFGDSKCVLGSQTCQMLALEIGLPETFVYGGAGKTYTIELRKIDLVESDKLNRAPLGDPKKGKGGGNRPAFREAFEVRK